jgi:Bax protein
MEEGPKLHLIRPPLPALLLALCLGLAGTAQAAAAWHAMGERLQALNTRILQDRARLIRVSDTYLTTDDISEDDFNWLKTTAELYGLQPRQRGDKNFFNALLSRIDAVPPSLALGQGWLEYAWRKAPPDACRHHCTPLLAPEDMHAWVHALNTGQRHVGFRARRGELRRQQKPLTAAGLAPALEPLTSEGPGYTHRLLGVIRRLRLDRWDPKS